ncbi:MAG: tetratricopeptide repeat protein, partial [Candidatus Sumerlaeaceae bacterium]
GKLFQQNDYLGARLEAKELILKYPESEEAIIAHFVLAQIYNADGQPDEALSELSQVLARKSQKDQEGIQALGFSIDILKRTKRYEEAYRLIDKYQKEYANDQLTSLQLSVARADVMAEAGQTTPARTMLEGFLKESTTPLERKQFRQLIAQTFLRENDPTAAARYFEAMFAQAPTNEDRRDIALRTAWFYAAAANYEKAREWTEKATQEFAKAIAEELDGRQKLMLAQVLANLYAHVGNLQGAKQILKAIYDAPYAPQEQLARVINDMVVTLLRMGKADEAIEFVREAAKRFPQSPLAQQAVQMETLKSQGKFDTVDTSPLVLRFATDTPIALDVKLLAADETTPPAQGSRKEEDTSAALLSKETVVENTSVARAAEETTR